VPRQNTLVYGRILEAPIAMESAPVKLSELADAFEFVSVGGNMGAEARAYISLDTGKIYWKSDYVDPDDPPPDDLETSDSYLVVPNKSELRLGRNLALSFIEEAVPGDFNKVAGFFQLKGAYARFKDLLERRDLLQRWYDFESSATERALAEWCEEHDIQLVQD
jgi:hypothetical protein